MATNLLSPAAKQRQLPSVGKSAEVQVSPLDEYRVKWPLDGANTNLPLDAMFVASTDTARTELVLSSDTSVTVSVMSCSTVVPPTSAPFIVMVLPKFRCS